MTKKAHSGAGHKAELGKLLRQLGHRHNLWQVFRDFVAMSALAFSNAADPWQREKREKEYLSIVAGYNADELTVMANGLGHVVMGLEEGHQDFLGSLFMSLELGDVWKGQFFTPYAVSLCMAKMSMHDAASYIERNGFVQVSDPCVGGGAMVIAAAHALQDAGLNYQQRMHVVAQDIDITAVHMAYVQFSLLNIPAVVVHGNSLRDDDARSTWRTLAHSMGGWDAKLEHRRVLEAAQQAESLLQPAGQPGPEVLPEQDQDQDRSPAVARVEATLPAFSEQFALF